MHVRLSNLDSGRPGRPVHPLELELGFPEEVDQDVDADVDRRADQEEQQPNVDELGKKYFSREVKNTRSTLV